MTTGEFRNVLGSFNPDLEVIISIESLQQAAAFSQSDIVEETVYFLANGKSVDSEVYDQSIDGPVSSTRDVLLIELD